MRAWIIVLMLIVAQSVSAATIKEISETKSLSNEIMRHFLKEEFTKGLDIAKEYWPLPPIEIDSLANQIKTQWSIVQQRFGKPTGMELVREERIGKSFVSFYYLHKFENHAIYWKFTYYKPKNEWKINAITFKDDFDFLFVPTK
ncbi:MAG: hypothetical protein KAU83_13020 [Bacteroidales bacterium]|nr:hypothetical protein [Bacteroidales bacterium]